MTFEWKCELSTGLNSIDCPNRELFKELEGLTGAIYSGRKEETGLILKRVEGFLERHFSAEEKFLEDFGCPGLSTHRSGHRTVLDAFRDMKGRHVSAGEAPDILMALFRLKDLLEAHMAMMDRAFAAFLTKTRPYASNGEAFRNV